MSMLRSLLLESFSAEYVLRNWRSLRLNRRIVVLMYHEVLEDTYPGMAWTAVKESEFERQLVYLMEHFEIISLKKALSIMEGEVSPKNPCVVLTFDDGYAGNRRVVLPIIEKLKIPITVFFSTKAIADQKPYWYDTVISLLDEVGNERLLLDLNRFGLGIRTYEKDLHGEFRWNRVERLLTDLKKRLPTERNEIVQCITEQAAKMVCNVSQKMMPMSIADVKEMAVSQFVTFGAHTHSHDILPQLDARTALQTILTSKELLVTWSGRDIDFFAYPNGDFNDETTSVVKQAGFAAAFTTRCRPWSKTDSVFTLPRIGVGRFDSLAIFKLKVSGLPA